MGALVVKLDPKSNKILKELAKKLGGQVVSIDDTQYEDIALGALMDKENRRKGVQGGDNEEIKTLMNVEFDKSFLKSLSKIKDEKSLKRIEEIILSLEESQSLNRAKNIKKLTGFNTYYRIRIGNLRLGFEQMNSQTIRLIIIAHRKDIYKRFP